jgi:hypothetical protein
VKERQDRRSKKLPDDFKERKVTRNRQKARNYTVWRTRFGKVRGSVVRQAMK